MTRRQLATATLFVLGLCGWTAIALTLWGAEMLGHDEARYAIAASDWIAGHPVRWNYVPYGMNLLVAPGILAGASLHALRLLPIVLGIGFVLAAARLAHRIAGARTAAWLVATLSATASVATRSAELLSDLPAALCLLVAITLLVDEIDRTGSAAPRLASLDPTGGAAPPLAGRAVGVPTPRLASLDRDTGPRWRVVWVAPLLAAAFYVRYGTCIPTAVIGVAVAAIGWRAIAARPAPAIATVALLAVLLAPHIAMSIRLTGSPLGIVRESSTLIGSGFAASLVTYTTSNPFSYFGITAPVLIAGVLSIARIRDRRRALLWAIAILDVVVLGLVPMPAVRFIVVGVALFALLGIDAIERAIAPCTPRLRAWFAALAAVALVAAWVQTEIAAYRLATTAHTRAASTALASDAIRRDAAGAPCEVIGRHTTQLQWYTGCEAVLVATAESIRRARVYVVIEPHGELQPDLQRMPSSKPTALLDHPGVTVTRLDPP